MTTKKSLVRHDDGSMVVNESVFKAGKPTFKYAVIKERYDAIAQKKAASLQARLNRQAEAAFKQE